VFSFGIQPYTFCTPDLTFLGSFLTYKVSFYPFFLLPFFRADTSIGHQREFIVAEAHGCKPIKSCRRRRKPFNPLFTCHNSSYSDDILADSFLLKPAEKLLSSLEARSIYPSPDSGSFISPRLRPVPQHELQGFSNRHRWLLSVIHTGLHPCTSISHRCLSPNSFL